MKPHSNMSASTSTSSGGSSSTPNPASHGHGLRTQLGHLIPRHALFQVHLHIDQLSNVPLIKGEFGVRWKFKNVQSGSGLLSKMKGHRSWSGQNRGKAAGAEDASGADEGEMDEEDEVEGDSVHDTTEDDHYAADSPRSPRDDEAERAFDSLHPQGAYAPLCPPRTPSDALLQMRRRPSSMATTIHQRQCSCTPKRAG